MSATSISLSVVVSRSAHASVYMCQPKQVDPCYIGSLAFEKQLLDAS